MALSKSRRFEVFKRDGFTCQYCGQRPPEVVLEVDHIEPRAKGGSDEEINLITSCWECNNGKRDRLLSEVHPRPDADLALTVLWNAITEDVLDWHPHPRLMRQFLAKYSPDIVEAALRDIAPKVIGGYLKGSYAPYMWTVMRNMSEEAE